MRNGRDAEQFHGLIRGVLEPPSNGYDPWFYQYCGDMAEPATAQAHLQMLRDLMTLADFNPVGKRVLDAGCGFGLTVLAFAALGASRSVGIEISTRMLATIEAYQDRLPEDIRARTTFEPGDVSALPYADESFDLVLSIEAISHYLDVPAFLAEAHRVLAPGGALVISDGNNGLNPVHVRKIRDVWEAFEKGTPGKRVHGHLVERPYVMKREGLIASRFPQLDPSTRRALAERTSGLVEKDIVSACERYEATGEMPKSTYRHGQLAVDPDGDVMERVFNPYALKRQLASNGFRVKVRGQWGGGHGNRVIRVINRILAAASPITMVTAPAFRIGAIRDSRPKGTCCGR